MLETLEAFRNESAGFALPAELTDYIIDSVAVTADRRNTLYACARTCKNWLPRSRFHIFHTVQISTFPSYDRLDAILRQTPEIGYCIRNLNLEIGAAGVSLVDQGRVLPVALLSRLPFVQSIKYYSALAFQTPSLRVQIAAIPRIDTVISFSINVCVIQRISDMIMLLSSFVSLKSLQLYEVFFLDRDYRACLADPKYRQQLPLTFLHLGSLLEAPAIFGWLTNTASTTSISTVSVGLDRSHNLKELNDFLQVCGESVRHISFRSRSMVANKFREYHCYAFREKLNTDRFYRPNKLGI